MKKFYESPEFDITKLYLPDLLSDDTLHSSILENGSSSGDDSDDGDLDL